MTSTITLEQQFYSNFNLNVQFLISARKKVNIQINNCLRKDDEHSLKIYTNIYLFIYCAWSEASLVKLVHTPFGFLATEKSQILGQRDILDKWKTCVDLAFNKFLNNDLGIPNRKQEIMNLLNSYLDSQRQIRNKIAHGQWIYPLFSSNLLFNEEAKIELDLVDLIQVDAWFDVFKEIIEIVQGLIDSRPRNNYLAHYNTYIDRLINIELILRKKMAFTLADKKARLKLKPIPIFT